MDRERRDQVLGPGQKRHPHRWSAEDHHLPSPLGSHQAHGNRHLIYPPSLPPICQSPKLDIFLSVFLKLRFRISFGTDSKMKPVGLQCKPFQSQNWIRVVCTKNENHEDEGTKKTNHREKKLKFKIRRREIYVQVTGKYGPVGRTKNKNLYEENRKMCIYIQNVELYHAPFLYDGGSDGRGEPLMSMWTWTGIQRCKWQQMTTCCLRFLLTSRIFSSGRVPRRGNLKGEIMLKECLMFS